MTRGEGSGGRHHPRQGIQSRARFFKNTGGGGQQPPTHLPPRGAPGSSGSLFLTLHADEKKNGGQTTKPGMPIPYCGEALPPGHQILTLNFFLKNFETTVVPVPILRLLRGGRNNMHARHRQQQKEAPHRPQRHRGAAGARGTGPVPKGGQRPWEIAVSS